MAKKNNFSIEESINRYLKENVNIEEEIQIILKNECIKSEQNIKNNNIQSMQELKIIAAKYLQELATYLTQATDEKGIETHIGNLLQFGANYFGDGGVRKQLNKNNKLQKTAGKIYKATLQFEKTVNKIIGQIAITIFVLDSPNGQVFFKLDQEDDDFWKTNPVSIGDNGKIIHEITFNKVQSMINPQGIASLNNLLTGTKSIGFYAENAPNAQKQFAKAFNNMLRQSIIKQHQNNIEKKDKLENQIESSKLKGIINASTYLLFYTQEEKVVRKATSFNSNQPAFISQKILQEAINSNNNIKFIGDRTKSFIPITSIMIENKSLYEILSDPEYIKALQDQRPKILETKMSKVRQFQWNKSLFSLDYAGSKGWMKEAFFGAYFGLESGTHQIKLKGKEITQVDLSQYDLLAYLANTDSTAARLSGDFNINHNKQNYAIQIKGQGSGVSLQQFIKLAKYIIQAKENIQPETFLNAIKEIDMGQSTTLASHYRPYQERLDMKKKIKEMKEEGIKTI